MTPSGIKSDPSSFRDPSGRIFYQGNRIYRSINPSYQKNYEALINSGLYSKLANKNLLVAHKEIKKKDSDFSGIYKVIEPKKIPFISYPYEWCFSQLKKAALLTLKIQKIALNHNLSLKDASAYNVQFIGSKEIFIDTLSFEIYPKDRPWIAYRQFCQHFLAPLSLMSKRDLRLNSLLQTNLDGIPLDFAAKLLPVRSKLNFGLFSHLYLQQKFQNKKNTD